MKEGQDYLVHSEDYTAEQYESMVRCVSTVLVKTRSRKMNEYWAEDDWTSLEIYHAIKELDKEHAWSSNKG